MEIAVQHHFQEGAVQHFHFRRVFAVDRILVFAADDDGFGGDVLGRNEVEGQVGERALAAPA
ncbi:hypothetical protein DSECCO2_605370 [anaerobic digester metagenome]